MNIRDFLISLQSEQAPIITDLVKSLGILETAQFGFSSDYLRHEFEVQTDDGDAAVRAINGSIVATMSNSILGSIQLPAIERLVEIDKILAKKWGGIQGFLNDKNRTMTYMRSILQLLAKAMIYGDDPTFGVPGAFKGLHQIAKANGNVVAQLSGASGSRTSIFAVHWSEGETEVVMPQEANGDIVQIELVGGGTLQAPTANTTTNARQLVYGANFWTNAALCAPSKASVAAITQIDSSHKPNAGQIDLLIDAVKGLADGKTFLYMNREGRRYLKELKNTKLSMAPGDTGYNTVVSDWDGIPVVLEESILSTETTALD
jgi:hypothetical protein